jgi:tRNA A-37 threonylcarbamoyl transferase component Bud32
MSAPPGLTQGLFAGRYAIERLIGEGATATVHLARDTQRGVGVAVKVLRPELANSAATDRFLKEIRRTSRLEHPHILPVLDTGEYEGRPFFVLPYMEGGTLRLRLRRVHQLDLSDALRIVQTIGDALDYAHAQGLIHRDVKPENILFTTGQAVLGDFGIAHALRAVYGESSTSSGIIRGTPAYMSPEQAAGSKDCDGRSDIYSLGCVAYEMVTGMPAFMGPTPEAVIAQRFAFLPREVRVYRPNAPPAVDTVLAKALAMTQADRYQTAGQLVDAIRSALTAPPSFAAGAKPKTASRRASNGSHRRARTVGVAGVGTNHAMPPSPGIALGYAADAASPALAILVRRARRWSLVVGALVAILGGIVLVRLRTADSASAVLPPDVAAGARAVAVLPFRVNDLSLAFLREGMVDLLAHKLSGELGPRAVEPRVTVNAATRAPPSSDSAAVRMGRDLGAAFVIRGEALGSAAHLVLMARMLPTTGAAPRVEAIAEGPADSVGSLVDRLVAQLLAGRAHERVERMTDLGRRPLPALRAYLDGQSAYRNGRLGDAVARFREALEEDSTFALAALGLARSGAFTSLGGAWRTDEVTEHAFALRDRLSPRDRALFDAFVGRGDPVEQTAARRLAEWRRALELFPDDPETVYGYGDHLFHLGEYLGLPEARRSARELFAHAVALDSSLAMPMAHLLELAAADGDTALVRRLGARYEALASVRAPEAAGYVRWRSAVARGAADELRALRARMDKLPSQSLHRIVTLAQLDAVGLDDADRAASVLAQRAALPQERIVSLFVVHSLELNRGRGVRARQTLAALRTLEPVGPGLLNHLVDTPVLAVLDALFGGGDSTEAIAAAAALAAGHPERLAQDGRRRAAQYAQLCTLELWRLERGEGRSSLETSALLRAAAAGPDSARPYRANPALCAAMIEATSAVNGHRADAAVRVAQLDSAMAEGPGTFGAEFGNLLTARLFERLGDTKLALRAIRRRRYLPADGAVYLAAQLRVEARLAGRLRDVASERRARGHLGMLLGK